MSSASTDDSPLLKLVKDMRANLRDLPTILRAGDLRMALLAVCAASLIGAVVLAFVQRVVKPETSPVHPTVAASDPRPAKPSQPGVGPSDKPRNIEPPGGGASTGGVDSLTPPEPAATPRQAGATVTPRQPAVEPPQLAGHAYMVEAGGVRIELAVAAQGVQEGWIGLAGGRKVERSTAAPQLRVEVSSVVLSNANDASCGSLLNAAVEFRVVRVSSTADSPSAPRKMEDTVAVCLTDYSDVAEARKDARRRALQKAIDHAIAER